MLKFQLFYPQNVGKYLSIYVYVFVSIYIYIYIYIYKAFNIGANIVNTFNN